MDFRYTSDEFEQIKPFLKDLFNQCKDDGNFNKYKNVLSAFIDILNFSDDFLKDIDECLDKNNDVVCLGNKWIEFNKRVKDFKKKFNDNNSSILINEKHNIEYIIGYFFLINYESFYFYVFYSNDKNKYDTCKSIVIKFESEIIKFDKDILLCFINIAIKTPRVAHMEYMKNHQLISEQLNNAEELIEEIKNYKSNCENLKSEIQNIENRLQNQRQEFNFIGLSNAFQKMKDNKSKELRKEKRFNWFLMTMIVLSLILKIVWSLNQVRLGELNLNILMIVITSFIVFIGILLYFFRISLYNIKAIQSQILQLDLRLSLCQFIHNYANDSKEMRENMKESLERFESVIFAPIVATDDKIPATLDGMEQLGKLIDMVK